MFKENYQHEEVVRTKISREFKFSVVGRFNRDPVISLFVSTNKETHRKFYFDHAIFFFNMFCLTTETDSERSGCLYSA